MTTSPKSGSVRLTDAAEAAMKLISRANARHESITGTELFKTAPEYAAAMAKVSEPCADMETFGSFIDAVYLFFYKGSGDGTRIQAFSTVPEFVSDVKFLASLRSDIKKGNIKEVSRKMAEANKILEKYSGKPPEALGPEDFLAMQIRILDQMSEFLAHLLR